MPYSTPPALDPDVRDAVADTIEHFNANHADSVLFLARFAAGATEAVDAEAVDVDALGVELHVHTARGPATARLEFATPVASAADVSAAVMAAIGRAREAAGPDVPLTSIERETERTATLPTFVTEVRRVDTLTPNLIEVVLGGGPGLGDYRSLGGDQFLLAIVAAPGAPELPDDYSMAQWMAQTPDERPPAAYYTVRSWDRAAAELTFWVVLHGHDAPGHGVGGWFGSCRPGDRLALWGPRAGFWGDGVYAPDSRGESRHHLFVTDESGFCAVAAIVEGLPAVDSATVIAETVDAGHAITFPGERTNVRWHYRHDQPPGTGVGLGDMVRVAVEHAGGSVATVFGAGESRQMSAIRRYLRHEAGMPASAVSMTGYWRRA